MGRKCCVTGCGTGYDADDKTPVFRLPRDNRKGRGGFRRYLVIIYQTVSTLLFVKNIGPVVIKMFCLMAGIGLIPPVCVSLCA